MKAFLLTVWMVVGIGSAALLWKIDLNNSEKREALHFASIEVRLAGDKEDLSQLRIDNVSLVRDILALKTDYAEVEKLSDSFNSYTAARKDVPAFKEFDELCGKVFMQLLAKEQELDARLKKLEGKKCR